MKCPFCEKGESEVLESRVIEDGLALRRRRQCLSCGKRYTTVERVKENTVLVVKKDGRREQFDKEKLRRGLTRSFEKRPVSWDTVNNLAREIEKDVLGKGVQEIASEEIGKLVLDRLYKIDHVAWIRFASVYFAFEEVEDFKKLINKKNKYEKK
jgi:transcriptional repressor NrdR